MQKTSEWIMAQYIQTQSGRVHYGYIENDTLQEGTIDEKIFPQGKEISDYFVLSKKPSENGVVEEIHMSEILYLTCQQHFKTYMRTHQVEDLFSQFEGSSFFPKTQNYKND